MIARALVAYHLAIYQSVLAVIGIVAVVRILWDYSWALCLLYGTATVGAYWVGQAGISLIQRQRARRSDSLD